MEATKARQQHATSVNSPPRRAWKLWRRISDRSDGHWKKMQLRNRILEKKPNFGQKTAPEAGRRTPRQSRDTGNKYVNVNVNFP